MGCRRGKAGLLAFAVICVAPGVCGASVPQDGWPLALDVLQFIPVSNEQNDGYNRSLFPAGVSADGDGCSTRSIVLTRDSLTPVTTEGPCAVTAGSWYSRYEGVTVTDPALVQVDHLVPLEEAWGSGAWQWDTDRRRSYANDLDDSRTLQVMTAAANRSKGAKDPSNWLPPNRAEVCHYLADWIAIKARWGMSADQSEHGRIRNLLTERCPDQRVAPWPAAPEFVTPAATLPPTTVPTIQQAVAVGGCDPAYPNVCIPPAPPDLDCADITDRRFTVLPLDPHNFDGDGNGIGCEAD